MRDLSELKENAKKLVSDDKGILAADESTGTIKKRFDAINLESTEETRQAYRELLFTAPSIEKYISGVIMYDETIRQSTKDGVDFVALLKERGIQPGIKVDTGKVAMPGFPKEYITEGLDGLRSRLEEYQKLGATFCKWRAAIEIGEQMPTAATINSNINQLARYTSYCHEAGLVAIVEPEVLMKGDHSIERCADVTKTVLDRLFAELFEHKVDLEGVILKINMIIPGHDFEGEISSKEIAEMTVQILLDSVSVAIPGVVFLSGGQSPKEATNNLNEINKIGSPSWPLTYSYGRALQESVIKTWNGKEENIEAAQKELLKRARLNTSAAKGEYAEDMEDNNE